MKAAIYVRVSTKDQVGNLSLPTQEKACREYCKRNGYDIDWVFAEEGESAKTTDRTELKRLLAHCLENKGLVKAVVVYSLSRFAREKYDHHFLRIRLARLGVTLRSATEPIDDSSSGKLMEGIIAAMAQFDNDVRAERTIEGMKARLERGGWTFPPPIGYVASLDPHGNKTIAGPKALRLGYEGVRTVRHRLVHRASSPPYCQSQGPDHKKRQKTERPNIL